MEYNLWKDADIELYTQDCDEVTKTEWDLSSLDHTQTGIKAWRVTEDDVEEWSLASNGKFFSEEVYIVLKWTYVKTSETTSYDIHCWVGKQATSRMYQRGLYATIALDKAMGGKALVHREVQDYESKRFTNYFEFFTVMKGKSDEMVSCDLNSPYKKRLLRVITGTKANMNICLRETAFKRGALGASEVFVIDSGTKIWQWYGELTDHKNESEKGIKYRVNKYALQLKAERGGNGITVKALFEDKMAKHDPFYDLFPTVSKKRKPSRQESAVLLGQKNMFKVKEISQSTVDFIFAAKDADVCSRKMKPAEVNIVDVRFGRRDAEDHLFVLVGDDWNGNKDSGLIYGHHYLKHVEQGAYLSRQNPELRIDPHPAISITVVKDGQQSTQLNRAIGF